MWGQQNFGKGKGAGKGVMVPAKGAGKGAGKWGAGAAPTESSPAAQHIKGKRDPSLHDANFINQFLQSFNAGVVLPTDDPNDETALIIKLLQKRSNIFKMAWTQYCGDYGGGRNDPTKHDRDFHLAFFDNLAQQAQVGGFGIMDPMMQMMQMMGQRGFDGPPQKRQKGSGGQDWGMSLGSDPIKDKLVHSIKAYQRVNEEHKTNWWTYCDSELGGVRDPARHGTPELQLFVTTYGVDTNIETWAAGSGGSHIMGQDPVKDALVRRVKTYQKMGEQQKDAWTNACGGTKDPARHEIPSLEQFVATYGVP